MIRVSYYFSFFWNELEKPFTVITMQFYLRKNTTVKGVKG